MLHGLLKKITLFLNNTHIHTNLNRQMCGEVSISENKVERLSDLVFFFQELSLRATGLLQRFDLEIKQKVKGPSERLSTLISFQPFFKEISSYLKAMSNLMSRFTFEVDKGK